MKPGSVVVFVAGILAVLGGETRAQSKATASVGATVLSPIAIVNVGPLDFGDVVSSAASGTVLITTKSTRAANGGGILGAAANGKAALFTVMGASDYAYGVALPSAVTVTSGTETMIVDTFTSDVSGTNGVTTDGPRGLAVGATLNIGVHQVAGPYSGSFDVTVAYN